MALLYFLLSISHAVPAALASTTPNHTRFDVLDLVDPLIGTANGGTIRATRFHARSRLTKSQATSFPAPACPTEWQRQLRM